MSADFGLDKEDMNDSWRLLAPEGSGLPLEMFVYDETGVYKGYTPMDLVATTPIR